uniref:Uncharacterized protein n=1 Tax=Amorphochlora amoebiformis TaxID=1561963 RepID=A0A7S0DL03_9EUKA|mmetsp:Transcript_32708/g.52653  ORF Transcript_32708/g.52653 Transcript_32708/m.52653 type:complete len:913 (+) Transcript_32708:1-2739(+)
MATSSPEVEKVAQGGRWPSGVVVASDGSYDVKLTTFSKEGMLESVSSADLVNVLNSSGELRKLKKSALMKFLKKSKAFERMDVASTLPKLQDRDLFQIVADNKELEKKLNIDAVFRVIKRAGRHAAVMRFTRENMFKLMVEARLKAYLSVEELEEFAAGRTPQPAKKRRSRSPAKRGSRSPRGAKTARSPQKDAEKISILKKMSREKIKKMLIARKLTEKMPHGALSKAVKQMTRADALACIGASDLKRILMQQGLMAKIQMEHILGHLRINKLLRIVTREYLDRVIDKFGLQVNMEQLVEIILAGKDETDKPEPSDEKESKDTPSGFDLSTLREILQAGSNNKGKEIDVRVVKMEFRRTLDYDNTSITVYGVAQGSSPVVPVCNISKITEFVHQIRPNSRMKKRFSHSEKPHPTPNPTKPPSENFKESDDKKSMVLDSVSSIGSVESSHSGDGDGKDSEHVEVVERLVLGAFLWDWNKQTLVLVSRSSDFQYHLLNHVPKELHIPKRDKLWVPPTGFFNDRHMKMSLSVEVYDEKRLSREAARCGLVPNAKQWEIIEKKSEAELQKILSSPKLLKHINAESVLRHVSSEALTKIINQIEDAKKSKKKNNSTGTTGAITSAICRVVREEGFDRVILRMRKDRVIGVLSMSNVIDYLTDGEKQSLKSAKAPEFFTLLTDLNNKYNFIKALSLPQIADSIGRMTLPEVLEVLKPKDLLETIYDYGIASSLPLVTLLQQVKKPQLLSILRNLDGAMIAEAVFSGKKNFGTKQIIEELFGPNKEAHNLSFPENGLLRHAKIGSGTKLLEFTISDAQKQRGTYFYGVLQTSSMICFVDMDRCALRFVREVIPNVVPGLLIWNTDKTQFTMLAQGSRTRVIEFAADEADFSRFSFDADGEEQGMIGKWKITVIPEHND